MRSSFFEWLQKLLALLASLGAILLAAGYAVVNTALFSVRMPMYNVAPLQYVAAGAFFLLEFVVNTAALAFVTWYLVKIFFHFQSVESFLDEYVPGCWQPVAFILSFVVLLKQFLDWGWALLIALVLSGIFMMVTPGLVGIAARIYRWLGAKWHKLQNKSNNNKALTGVLLWMSKTFRFPPFGKIIYIIRSRIARILPRSLRYLIIAAPISLVWSYIYCAGAYASTPQFLGGGEIPCVNLVFKDPKEIAVLDLTQLVADDHRTGRVGILAVMNDGLLVLDQGKGRAVEVNNDLIDGYVRCDPLDGFPTPTAFPTATATATATPMPILTPTPSQPAPTPT